MTRWSSSFAKWVVTGWDARAKAVDGDAIAESFRANLLDPVGAIGRARQNEADSRQAGLARELPPYKVTSARAGINRNPAPKPTTKSSRGRSKNIAVVDQVSK
jgi:hypothetical protein